MPFFIFCPFLFAELWAVVTSLFGALQATLLNDAKLCAISDSIIWPDQNSASVKMDDNLLRLLKGDMTRDVMVYLMIMVYLLNLYLMRYVIVNIMV